MKIYAINNNYIDYLKEQTNETRIMYNLKPNSVFQRTYVGILFNINDVEYFAPLSSSFFDKTTNNQKKHFTDIYVNHHNDVICSVKLNNMIPIAHNTCKAIDIDMYLKNKDEYFKKYGELLVSQERAINNYKQDILKKALFYIKTMKSKEN